MAFYLPLTVILLTLSLALTSILRRVNINKTLHSKIELDQAVTNEVKEQFDFKTINLSKLDLIEIFYTALKVNIHSLDKYGKVNLKGKIIDTLDDLKLALNNSIDTTIDSKIDALHNDMLFYEPIESSLFVEDFNTESSGSSAGFTDILDDLGLKNIAGKIPVIALATRTFKDFKKYDNLEIEEEVLVTNLAVNTVSLTASSYKGIAIGTKLGTYFAPATSGASLVLGPIIGGALGIVTGDLVSKTVKKWWYGKTWRKAKKEHEDAEYELRRSFQNLAGAYRNNYSELKQKLSDRHNENIIILTKKIKSHESLLKRIFFPSLMTIVWIKTRKEIKRVYSEVTVPYYKNMLDKIEAESHYPLNSGKTIFLQGENKFFGIDAITLEFSNVRYRINKLKRAVSAYNMETRELNKKL